MARRRTAAEKARAHLAERGVIAIADEYDPEVLNEREPFDFVDTETGLQVVSAVIGNSYETWRAKR